MESMLRGALIVNVYVLQPPPSSIHPSNEYHVGVLPYIQLINGTVQIRSESETKNSWQMTKGSLSYRLFLEFDQFPHTTSPDSCYSWRITNVFVLQPNPVLEKQVPVHFVPSNNCKFFIWIYLFYELIYQWSEFSKTSLHEVN